MADIRVEGLQIDYNIEFDTGSSFEASMATNETGFTPETTVFRTGDQDIFYGTDYNSLRNKPQIEGVTLQGNKSFEDLTLSALTNSEIDELIGE